MNEKRDAGRTVEMVQHLLNSFSGSASDIAEASFVLKSVAAEVESTSWDASFVGRLRAARNQVELVNAVLIERGVDPSPTDVGEVTEALRNFLAILNSSNPE